LILTEQQAVLLKPAPGEGLTLLKAIEFAGRNCYASHAKTTEDSCLRFTKSLIERGHEAPLEFADLTFDITTSRAVLAEMTRHRLASFCVESQRYIQEAKTGDITFILPEWFDSESGDSIVRNGSAAWYDAMLSAESTYKTLISLGMKPEQAREVLPNSTACRIIMKANVREWRHIFELRCSPAAYPQMRSLATKMLKLSADAVPVAFDDLYHQYVSKEGSAVD
jgi:thymidylate synthase (FAD)